MVTDAKEIKRRIISTLNYKGPLLPIYIAKEIGLDMIFTSAFLSELISEKEIQSTYMRVGSSPIYFLKEHESQLEKYQEYIKGKEKEALQFLKEKLFLKDEIQEPSIRVALRQLKDFAIPFQKEEKIIWRYFIASEEDYKREEVKKQEILPEQTTSKNEIDFEEKPKPEKQIKKEKSNKKIISKKLTKSISQKKNEKFFDLVKENLNQKKIEILGIEGFNKEELFLIVKENHEEKLLIAFNKKRITEEDIIKAYKKSSETNKKFIILSLGETSKKLENLIKAIKNLSKIEKIE